MSLVHQSYGKARVRILRVTRHPERHEVHEACIRVTLEGEFTRAYTAADNALVVPTDTMKNLVQVLAHHHPEVDNETFALILARDLLARYSHVVRVRVDLEATPWQRLYIDGQPHAHSFVQASPYTPFIVVNLTRTEEEIVSGIRDFALMKTTQSGFTDFWQDDHTTLAPTTDRILATRLQAHWRVAHMPDSWSALTQTVCTILPRVFATTYSASVQDSLWRMGEAVLAAVPDITTITLAMPNLHYHTLDLSHFGLDTRDRLFLPTDEPHGHIEATIDRE